MKRPANDGGSPRLLAPFRRVTGGGSFIPEIDGLRFIAIFVVVLFHLAVGLAIKSPAAYANPGTFVSAIAWNGFRGVELFFVISGFILALPFASHLLQGTERVDLKRYFIRRLTRLEPPYILCLLVLFALAVLVKGQSAARLLPHLLAGMAYLHNLLYAAESPLNNVTWSLEIEVQFYILAPFLAGLFAIRGKARRRAVISLICLASIVLSWLLIAPGQRAYLSILRFLHFFLLGFLLADVYLTEWHEQPARTLGWDLVSLLGWPLLLYSWQSIDPGVPAQAFRREPALTALLAPGVVFLLYCAAFRGTLSNRVIRNPWITTIGGMCYTVYLLHNPALGVILARTRDIAPTGSYAINLGIQLALATPPLLAISAGYFLLIEKPCMRRDWPRRLLERIQSRGAVVPEP